MDIVVDNESVVELKARFTKFDEKMRAGLILITKQVAIQMQDWAKTNASWTDRTGNARKGLKASAKWEDYFNLVVSMSHTVDYGKWLELAYSGNYAILRPAIEKYKNEFIRQWEKIINGIEV